MEIHCPHSWNVCFTEAVEIQNALRGRVVLKELEGKIRHVAGVDLSSSKKSNVVWAGVVVFRYSTLEMVEERWARSAACFPYVPGFLSFREIPTVLKAVAKLKREPDVFFCDGQGIAHPRGMGLAAHLGLILRKPAIGCAKKRLIGEYAEPGETRGDHKPLVHQGVKLGAVLRTRTGVKPLFVSPGYAITIDNAVRMVLECGGRYRIPTPIRGAHLLVNRLRRDEEEKK